MDKSAGLPQFAQPDLTQLDGVSQQHMSEHQHHQLGHAHGSMGGIVASSEQGHAMYEGPPNYSGAPQAPGGQIIMDDPRLAHPHPHLLPQHHSHGTRVHGMASSTHLLDMPHSSQHGQGFEHTHSHQHHEQAQSVPSLQQYEESSAIAPTAKYTTKKKPRTYAALTKSASVPNINKMLDKFIPKGKGEETVAQETVRDSKQPPQILTSFMLAKKRHPQKVLENAKKEWSKLLNPDIVFVFIRNNKGSFLISPPKFANKQGRPGKKERMRQQVEYLKWLVKCQDLASSTVRDAVEEHWGDGCGSHFSARIRKALAGTAPTSKGSKKEQYEQLQQADQSSTAPAEPVALEQAPDEGDAAGNFQLSDEQAKAQLKSVYGGAGKEFSVDEWKKVFSPELVLEGIAVKTRWMFEPPAWCRTKVSQDKALARHWDERCLLTKWLLHSKTIAMAAFPDGRNDSLPGYVPAPELSEIMLTLPTKLEQMVGRKRERELLKAERAAEKSQSEFVPAKIPKRRKKARTLLGDVISSKLSEVTDLANSLAFQKRKANASQAGGVVQNDTSAGSLDNRVQHEFGSGHVPLAPSAQGQLSL